MLSDATRMTDAELIAELERIVCYGFEDLDIASDVGEFDDERGFWLCEVSMHELRNLVDALAWRHVLKYATVRDKIPQIVRPEPEPPEPAA